jgi:hypothetical protein
MGKKNFLFHETFFNVKMQFWQTNGKRVSHVQMIAA